MVLEQGQKNRLWNRIESPEIRPTYLWLLYFGTGGIVNTCGKQLFNK